MKHARHGQVEDWPKPFELLTTPARDNDKTATAMSTNGFATSAGTAVTDNSAYLSANSDSEWCNLRHCPPKRPFLRKSVENKQ
jgi:hypothetical protein